MKIERKSTYNNDELLTFLNTEDILPNSLLTSIYINLDSNSEEVNILLSFQTMFNPKIEEIKISFFNVNEYGFYHNSKHYFYNVDYYKFKKNNDNEYYMSLDPNEEESKNDNDFIKAEKNLGEIKFRTP